MEKKKTKTTTIRLPLELMQRIDELAAKNMTSRNKWIVRTLLREARPH